MSWRPTIDHKTYVISGMGFHVQKPQINSKHSRHGAKSPDNVLLPTIGPNIHVTQLHITEELTDVFKPHEMSNSLITNSYFVGNLTQERIPHKTMPFIEIRTFPNLISNSCKQKKMQVLSKPTLESEDYLHHHRKNTYMQKELYIPNL